MPKFPPTPEQQAILDAVTQTKDNILVSALAGAAKTSTLELIANALPGTNAICLAFNKRIAEEMSERLPSGFKAQTLNSLGHGVWGQTLGTRLRLDTSKCYKLMLDEFDQLTEVDKEDLDFGDLLNVVGDLKTVGWVPDKYSIPEGQKASPLCDDAEAQATIDFELSDFEWKLVERVYSASLDLAFQGTIDFDDQLLMPAVFKAVFPIYSLILVDEAQDLSVLNHRLLERLYRRRIIAVGDQCQAIYAFRGAHESGMSFMRQSFAMHEFPLSCSFRCPEAVVEHVRWRAPHMVAWAQNAEKGQVKVLPYWTYSDIPDNAAIICRNNAPLFSHAVGLLKIGRRPNLWGTDIAKGILKTMKSLGPLNMDRDSALTSLQSYLEARLAKVKNPKPTQDRVECMAIMIRQSDTLAGAIKLAETIFSSEGSVNLLTGHKSKGHEFDNVFFLDSKLVGTEGQEPNLRYVICTRAKRTLTYITSEGLVTDEE